MKRAIFFLAFLITSTSSFAQTPTPDQAFISEWTLSQRQEVNLSSAAKAIIDAYQALKVDNEALKSENEKLKADVDKNIHKE